MFVLSVVIAWLMIIAAAVLIRRVSRQDVTVTGDQMDAILQYRHDPANTAEFKPFYDSED